MAPEQLMIFGGSTRAAAQSARRAGFDPVCADHFADEDLYESARVLPLESYPKGLRAAAAAGPQVPWMYTGALENHPELLRELEALRPLWGNPSDVVAQARDPFLIADTLRSAGLPALEVRPEQEPPPADGRWLLKPLRGGGGRGIRVWDVANSSLPPPNEAIYFQQPATGQPYSALYLATSAQAVLVGVTRQLIGEARLDAAPFAYCGSFGPVRLPERIERQLAASGQALTSAFGLRGLFGIDFIVEETPKSERAEPAANEKGVAWMTEINPRYTASIEIYEQAFGLTLIRDHVLASSAFAERDRSQNIAGDLQARLEVARRSHNGSTSGKLIVYAPFDLRTPRLAALAASAPFADAGVLIADRPAPGSLVPAGAPLCTLIAGRLKSPNSTERESLWSALELPLGTVRDELERHRQTPVSPPIEHPVR